MSTSRLVLAGRILAVGLCAALMSGAPIFGASISYPDVSSSTLIFSKITESSLTDPVPLFGPPTLDSAEALRFESGMNFSSFSTGAGGVDITDGKLYVQIDAVPGGFFDVVTVNEIGRYVIAGAGATSATQVSVNCLGLSLAITGIDGVSVDGPVATGTMDFHLGVTDWSGTATTNGSGTWTGGAKFLLAPLLIGTPWEGHHVTEATLVFDNLLTSQSEAGSSAFIETEAKWITPEPGTLVLLSIAALGLFMWRRVIAGGGKQFNKCDSTPFSYAGPRPA